MPNPSILLFISEPQTTTNDNHHRLPKAFADAGWRVAIARHDSLTLAAGKLLCNAGELNSFDHIWLLGFGDAGSFFDRMQLLLQLQQQQANHFFVTSPSALLALHGKFHHLQYSPTTYVSNNLDYLCQHIQPGQRWVVKPTAGSNAEGVTFVNDVATATAALTPLIKGGRYAILQRYAERIENGETRILCAAGIPFASYQRMPSANGLANLSRGGQALNRLATPSAYALARHIAQDLLEQGVMYCAVDLAGEQLIETNIANPGGLGTIAALTGEDPCHRLIALMSEHWGYLT